MKYVLVVLAALTFTGCAYDPFLVSSIETLKSDHEALIDEYNDKVDPDLDPDFVASELGAYDDVIDYIKADSE